jgi:hypothetical protein
VTILVLVSAQYEDPVSFLEIIKHKHRIAVTAGKEAPSIEPGTWTVHSFSERVQPPLTLSDIEAGMPSYREPSHDVQDRVIALLDQRLGRPEVTNDDQTFYLMAPSSRVYEVRRYQNPSGGAGIIAVVKAQGVRETEVWVSREPWLTETFNKIKNLF